MSRVANARQRGNTCEFPTYNDPSGKRENPEDETENAEAQATLVQIYPNPTTGLLNVRFAGEMDQHYQLRLASVNGQLIMEMDIFESMTVLDISDLNKGVYFVEIDSAPTGENAWRGKLILID